MLELRVRLASTGVPVLGTNFASGYRVALAIIASLIERPRATLLTLEEADTGLHPLLLQWLVELLRKESEHGFILLTTRHPWLVDNLALEELRILELKDGATVVHAPAAEGEARERLEQALGTLAMTGMLR